MKNVYALALIVFLFLSANLFAQDKTVSGVVTSVEDNMSIPGVTVMVKGTMNGTTTDIDGKFTLGNVSSSDTLVFTYIGMAMVEKNVGSQDYFTIFMESDISNLDEVVVIGYGTVKKEDVTGSVSIVGSKTIEKLKPVKIEQALQ